MWFLYKHFTNFMLNFFTVPKLIVEICLINDYSDTESFKGTCKPSDDDTQNHNEKNNGEAHLLVLPPHFSLDGFGSLAHIVGGIRHDLSLLDQNLNLLTSVNGVVEVAKTYLLHLRYLSESEVKYFCRAQNLSTFVLSLKSATRSSRIFLKSVRENGRAASLFCLG